MTDPNPTPTAVRIARFSFPHYEKSGGWWVIEGNERVALLKTLSQDTYGYGRGDVKYSLGSLDDLALAEQKVCAAGLGKDYTVELSLKTHTPGDGELTGGIAWKAVTQMVTATAATRAAALVAVLDAHPELEEVK